MPIPAEYETDQLHKSAQDSGEKERSTTYGGSERPYISRRAPSEIQLCLWTSIDCRTDHVTFFERSRVWIKSIHIATISQYNSAEAGGAITMVDENVVGLNVYFEYSIRTAVGRAVDHDH